MRARILILTAAFTAALAVAASTAALMPGEAKAYYQSEIGASGPAMVWCDASTNTIWVAPTVGAGLYYKGQWIRYRFWAKDLETGQLFWLGGDYWRTLYHKRVGDPYYDILGNYYPGQETKFEPNAPQEAWVVSGMTLKNNWNRYHVFAQYQWYSSTARAYIGDARPETGRYNIRDYSILSFSGWSQAFDCYL